MIGGLYVVSVQRAIALSPGNLAACGDGRD
jgi:hypothetical protein